MGTWVLAIMIYSANHEIILIPFKYYDTWQDCNAWKGDESMELGVPLVCTQESGA